MNSIKYGLFALSVIYVVNSYADAQVVDATPIDLQQIRAQAPVIQTQASETQVQTSNLSLQQRVAKLEQQLENSQQLNLIGQLASLQQAIEQLRGQLDVISHEQKQQEQRLNNFYQDLNKRLEDNFKVKPKLAAPSAATKPMPVPTKSPNKIKKVAQAASSTVGLQTEAEPMKNDTDNFPLATTDQEATDAATTQSAMPVSKPITEEPSADKIQEQNAYQTAYNALKNRNYAQAIPAMESYLQHYPTGKNVASAHYWLGELYMVQGQTDKAASHFNTIITQYPQDAKLADATLKLGIIYYNKGQYQEAKATFNEVKVKFPGSAAARLAQRRLQEITSSGH